MPTSLAPNRVLSSEEFLMSQVIQHEALTRLLLIKGILTKEECLEMARVVDQGMKKK